MWYQCVFLADELTDRKRPRNISLCHESGDVKARNGCVSVFRISLGCLWRRTDSVPIDPPCVPSFVSIGKQENKIYYRRSYDSSQRLTGHHCQLPPQHTLKICLRYDLSRNSNFFFTSGREDKRYAYSEGIVVHPQSTLWVFLWYVGERACSDIARYVNCLNIWYIW